MASGGSVAVAVNSTAYSPTVARKAWGPVGNPSTQLVPASPRLSVVAVPGMAVPPSRASNSTSTPEIFAPFRSWAMTARASLEARWWRLPTGRLSNLPKPTNLEFGVQIRMGGHRLVRGPDVRQSLSDDSRQSRGRYPRYVRMNGPPFNLGIRDQLSPIVVDSRRELHRHTGRYHGGRRGIDLYRRGHRHRRLAGGKTGGEQQETAVGCAFHGYVLPTPRSG